MRAGSDIERKLTATSTAQWVYSRVSSTSLQKTRLPGWGGRIRTSAWWNQNPLPYHLATPQQTVRNAADDSRADSFRQRRSIEGVEPFQPPGAEFAPDRDRRSVARNKVFRRANGAPVRRECAAALFSEPEFQPPDS